MNILQIRRRKEKTHLSSQYSRKIYGLIIIAMLSASLFMALLPSCVRGNPEWLTGWRYRRTITIDKVDAVLTDFPVLIHLSAASGKGSSDVTSIFDEVGSNYNAIAFVDGSGNRLNFEVEKWDATNRAAWIWLKTSLSGTSNTVLYMYYDSTKDGSSYNSGSSVWQNNFTAVWHLSEPGTGTRLDSTSNHNDATPVGYDGDEKATGKIDGADDFDNTNDYLDCGTADSLNFDYTDAFSVSLWIRRDTFTTYDFIISKQLSSGTIRGYTLWIDLTSKKILWDFFHDYSASPAQQMTVASQSTITDTNWHYMVAQYDGSMHASGMEIYIDGQKESVSIINDNIVGTIQTSVPFCIAARYGGNHPFDGPLDEVEVSNATRSSSWIKACQETQKDQIMTWGAEQQQNTNSVSQSSPTDMAKQTQWTVNFNYKIAYYDTPKNACLRIFNLTDSTLVSTVWNNTALQNDTSINYGSYTFSSEQEYKWDCVYYNNSGNSWTSDSNWTLNVDVPPRYQNVGENATAIPKNGTIELYGQGYDGVGLDRAWLSTNETGAWMNYTVSIPRQTDWDGSKYALNPVLSPGTGGGWTTFGSIVKENSSCWWYYYTSAPPAGSPMSISRAESTDGGYTWVKDTANNPILTPNSSSSWENTNLLCPWVWKEESTWHMLYTGTGSSGVQAGYANSTDGAHWLRYSGNPVLRPSGGWESGGNEIWGVMKVNSTYYAWYSPWPAGAPPTPLRQVGLATSTDLLNWNKDPKNPIFGASSPDYGRYCVCPFKYEEYYYMLVPYGWQNGTFKFELFKDSEPTFYPETRTSLGWVVSLGTSGEWDSWFIDTPYVATDNITRVLNDGAMLVYYSGTGNSAITPYGTGLIVLDTEQALTGVPGVYSSPQYMNEVADSWCWSNFTWNNRTVQDGTTIAWKIWYEDTSGNWNSTGTMTFFVGTGQPTLRISPSLTEKSSGDVGTTFDVNVTITDVTDLRGFDFNVTWDPSLLTLASVGFNTTLDSVWGNGNWVLAVNQSGAGYYKLVAVSTANSFNSTTATSLARLEFLVKNPQSNPLRQTSIHFDTHKLSDSQYNAITHTVTDGTYRISGETPTLQMNPTSRTCRKYNETFTVQISLSNAFDVTDFEFEIHYNTTLLNYTDIAWNAWGSGTITIDEVNGNITGFTSGSATSGTQTLITLQFNATFYHIWKDENKVSNWKNDQSGQIYIQWANLSYSSNPDLAYVKGGTNNQINAGPDVTYTFSPIQGDVDNNGSVNVFDLRTIAAYYDQAYSTYDLNGDGIIDIFDLVVIGANFGFTYP